jgi:hypothetical protein
VSKYAHFGYIFVIGELVGAEKYAAVSESEVGCDLGHGVKSRELTHLWRSVMSREYEVHLFGHSRDLDLVGDGGSFSATLRRLRCGGAVL